MLVAIEGIDGSGKATQTRLLKEHAQADGYSVGTLAFPRYGQTLMAQSAADYLNGKFGAMDALPAQFPALLFAGDRLESRDLIEQLLVEKDLLLIDRYVGSNLAHQAAKVAAEERPSFVEWLDKIEHDVYRLPRPAMTLYLDVPVDVSDDLIARKAPRSYTAAAADLHEADRAYQAICRDVYAYLATTGCCGTWVTVQCVAPSGTLRSVGDIHDEAWQHVREALEKARGA